MARATPAQNEASVLSFRREQLGEGAQVAHVSLRRGESSLVHSHTNTRDTFYVVSGRLSVTLYESGGASRPSHWTTCSEAAEIRRQGDHLVRRFCLRPGDVLVIEPGVVHCAANLHEAPCSFLCIEGIGVYDFVLAEGS
ncbi:MAG: cupin domain-containing protein [Myxococcota bacterium]